MRLLEAPALENAKRLIADKPAQQARLDALDRSATTWIREVAEKEIALMDDAATRDQTRALEASGAGRTMMDAVRAKAAESGGGETDLMAVHLKEHEASASLASATTLVGTAASLALAALTQRLAQGDEKIVVADAERQEDGAGGRGVQAQRHRGGAARRRPGR